MNVEETLENAGGQFIRQGVELNQVDEFLRNLRKHTSDCDRVQIEVVRAGAIQLLKDAGIQGATRMVDAALKRSNSVIAGEEADPRDLSAILQDPEPHPEPVGGTRLAEEIESLLKKYIVLPDHAAVVVTMWIFHTYLFDARHITPYLGICAPEKRCGKSTLLDLLAYLCHRPWPVSSTTSAAIYRLVQDRQPTLLLDEGHRVFKKNDAVKDVYISAHRKRFAFVTINIPDEKDGYKPAIYSTWSPKAYTSIGKPPDDQLLDRSLIIWLKRKMAEEAVEEWIDEEVDQLLSQYPPKLFRWANDHFDQVKAQRVADIPPSLHDRERDNWRPLLAIADLLGGRWPEKVRGAAQVCSDEGDGSEESIRVLLLIDIKAFWEQHSREKCPSQGILDYLNTLEHRPWPEYGNSNKPLSTKQLASLLRHFEIRPKQLWIDGEKTRGYERGWFEEAFTRYASPSETVGPVGPSADAGLRGIDDPVGTPSPTVSKNGENTDEQCILPGLPDQPGGDWEDLSL